MNDLSSELDEPDKKNNNPGKEKNTQDGTHVRSYFRGNIPAMKKREKDVHQVLGRKITHHADLSIRDINFLIYKNGIIKRDKVERDNDKGKNPEQRYF